MSKKSPKLPMGGAGFREAKRQLKQREKMKAMPAKKKKKKAS